MPIGYMYYTPGVEQIAYGRGKAEYRSTLPVMRKYKTTARRGECQMHLLGCILNLYKARSGEE